MVLEDITAAVAIVQYVRTTWFRIFSETSIGARVFARWASTDEIKGAKPRCIIAAQRSSKKPTEGYNWMIMIYPFEIPDSSFLLAPFRLHDVHETSVPPWPKDLFPVTSTSVSATPSGCSNVTAFLRSV